MHGSRLWPGRAPGQKSRVWAEVGGSSTGRASGQRSAVRTDDPRTMCRPLPQPPTSRRPNWSRPATATLRRPGRGRAFGQKSRVWAEVGRLGRGRRFGPPTRAQCADAYPSRRLRGDRTGPARRLPPCAGRAEVDGSCPGRASGQRSAVRTADPCTMCRPLPQPPTSRRPNWSRPATATLRRPGRGRAFGQKSRVWAEVGGPDRRPVHNVPTAAQAADFGFATGVGLPPGYRRGLHH